MPWAEYLHLFDNVSSIFPVSLQFHAIYELCLTSWSSNVLSHPRFSLKKHIERTVRGRFLRSATSICAPSSHSVMAGLSPLGGALSQQAESDSIFRHRSVQLLNSSTASTAGTSDICCLGRGPARRRGRRRCCCEPGWTTLGSPCTKHTVHISYYTEYQTTVDKHRHILYLHTTVHPVCTLHLP